MGTEAQPSVQIGNTAFPREVAASRLSNDTWVQELAAPRAGSAP